MAEPPSPLDRLVLLGRIAAPFGIQGWVKIQPYTEEPSGLRGYPIYWVGAKEPYKQYEVEQVAVHGRSVLCKLQGVSVREQAALLKGCEVGVLRHELPQSDPGEFYWTDLIGVAVVNTEGIVLGIIAKMADNGAQSVMVVNGERERLIPFVAPIVTEVSLEKQQVIVEWGADF
ncbi:MAG: ribosome maturation factor RimM [Burkholderiales bacterium]